MIRFANGQALALFWLLPVLIGLAWFMGVRAKKRLLKVFGAKVTPFLTSSLSQSKRRLKLVFRLLAGTFFILALARPQLGKSLQEVKVRGIELVIALDVSNSMLAEDVKPSRLEAAKSELMRLVDMLEGDKVGIIAFAGSAALVSPLTTDAGSLKMFIETLSPQSVETQGTNIAGAIDEAKEAFERGGLESDDRTRVTKVMLLISDGEDHEPGAIKLAEKYASEMRIFTVAFGTEHGGPIPIRDERGYLVGYKRDRTGQNVNSVVNAAFLRELATAGRGSFHHASVGGMDAGRVKKDLDQLEKTEFASSLATSYDERFQLPLLIGILFALAEFLLGEGRTAGRLWKGRFEVAGK